jgi:hypothetical protein
MIYTCLAVAGRAVATAACGAAVATAGGAALAAGGAVLAAGRAAVAAAGVVSKFFVVYCRLALYRLPKRGHFKISVLNIFPVLLKVRTHARDFIVRFSHFFGIIT